MHDLYSGMEKAEFFACWWTEHLLGPRAQGSQGYFGKKKDELARRFQDRLIEKRSRWKLKPLASYTSISEKDFTENFLIPGRPVVIRGAAKNWGAVGKWTPRWFAENYPEQKHPFVDPESKGYGFKELTFREIADEIEKGSKSYVKFSNLLHTTQELEKDFDMSLIERYRGVRHLASGKQLFMGGKGTNSGMHAALANVFFIQVYGRKRWLLLPEEWAPVINPQVDRQPHFLVQEELMFPYDCENDQIFSRLEYTEVILEPGDFYFNPAFCWHYVENLSTSIGLGFRWIPLRAFYRSPLLSSVITMSQYPASFMRVFQNTRGKYFPKRWP
jgi:lysine-specific demethylase 8